MTELTDKSWPLGFLQLRYRYLQYPLHGFQESLGIAMQKTIISRSSKALGQGVLQDKGNKVLSFQPTALHLFRGAVFVLKGDEVTIIINDVVVTDHTPIEIAGQVL